MAKEVKDTHACTLDKIISLCKRRGFVYQASEIYGGQAGAWDYGPLGVEFKNNIKSQKSLKIRDSVIKIT